MVLSPKINKSSVSGRHASTQQSRIVLDNSRHTPTHSYADATSGKSRFKSTPKNERSLITANAIFLVFQTGTFTHSVFYKDPKSLQHLQTALHINLRLTFPPDVGLGLSVKHNSTNTMIELALASAEDCSKTISSPIAAENHEFSAPPAYSSVNALHRISLTGISPALQEIMKSCLLLTFARFGAVKDIVICNDDITGG